MDDPYYEPYYYKLSPVSVFTLLWMFKAGVRYVALNVCVDVFRPKSGALLPLDVFLIALLLLCWLISYNGITSALNASPGSLFIYVKYPNNSSIDTNYLFYLFLFVPIYGF